MPFAKRKQNLNVAREIKLHNNSKYSFCSGMQSHVCHYHVCIWLSMSVIMMWICAGLCCVVFCMNCSFEESWRESMLMMILQLCCPAISPWMTLMTWMTLTMMIMMMRVFTWKVCQWGRMTSTGGWQRWHGSLTPVTRKFPDTKLHSSGWLLFPDVGISQLCRSIFITWMWPRHWESVFSLENVLLGQKIRESWYSHDWGHRRGIGLSITGENMSEC